MAGKQQSENNTSQNIIKISQIKEIGGGGRGQNLNKSKYHYTDYDTAKNKLFKEKKNLSNQRNKERGGGAEPVIFLTTFSTKYC